jgi:hypothetical protein
MPISPSRWLVGTRISKLPSPTSVATITERSIMCEPHAWLFQPVA